MVVDRISMANLSPYPNLREVEKPGIDSNLAKFIQFKTGQLLLETYPVVD
jgi:hypothetical protein